MFALTDGEPVLRLLPGSTVLGRIDRHCPSHWTITPDWVGPHAPGLGKAAPIICRPPLPII